MSWRQEKTETGIDLVWDGVELGIGPSPTKGTANLQNVNIATESGEVMASYARTNQAQISITDGTLTPDGATNFTGPATLQAGQWISVSASTVSSISTTSAVSTVDVDYLVVGGGGGGGGANSPGTNLDASAGGGGAGAFVTDTAAIAVGNYPITVGDGGDGGSGLSELPGGDGEDSVFAAIDTAPGGGGGGSTDATTDDGRPGGSGGGGGSDDSGGTSGAGGTGTPDNDGGAGSGGEGGGGGGANANGASAAPGDGGDGGNGLSSSISGVPVFYAGGGGGGAAGGVSPVGGAGGDGGGGDGGSTTGGSSETPATPGSANTGGGGGGGGSTDGLDMDGQDGGSGIVIISYVTGSCIATGGTVTYTPTNTVHTFTESGTFSVVFIPTQTNLYYVSYKSGTTFKLSSKFDPTGANALTHGTTGSITFSTVATPNQGVAKAVEKYTNATSTEYRYYIMDANSRLWVFDSYIYATYGTQWMLPDPNNYSTFRLTGLGVLNGMVLAVGKGLILGKPVTDLGRIYWTLQDVFLNEPFPTHNNFAMVGSQGKMYYCDGNYIGEVFATTSIVTSIANIQSMSSYTSATTVGTITSIISGSLPYDPGGVRIPAVFFTDVYGTQPTNLDQSELYYIEYNPSGGTFQVFNTLVSTTPVDMSAGASGNQYFTTFWPYGEGAVDSATPLVQVSTQRVNLPAYETAQTMVEVGNNVLIGGLTNTVYPWNQIDATPGDFIALPEANVKVMVNVNNIAYIFAGNKGNVYITNGAVASLALKVPDYCAGVPGTPITYIEPVFSWGDADYVRGRVYFSILDQTATKAGNCGGVWSFVPSQNVDPSQDIGMALRLENQNSYGNYGGVANLIIASMEQDVTSPQYWASWQSSYSVGTSTFGIDFTATTPVTQYIVETDLLPTGTFLNQETFQQLEYKLTSPLLTGDSIALFYRLNGTTTWTACDTIIEETTNRISGYVKANFQKSQWTQFRAVVTTPGTTASSFVRLAQLRLR